MGLVHRYEIRQRTTATFPSDILAHERTPTHWSPNKSNRIAGGCPYTVDITAKPSRRMRRPDRPRKPLMPKTAKRGHTCLHFWYWYHGSILSHSCALLPPTFLDQSVDYLHSCACYESSSAHNDSPSLPFGLDSHFSHEGKERCTTLNPYLRRHLHLLFWRGVSYISQLLSHRIIPQQHVHGRAR